MTNTSSKWTLDKALVLIRLIQPECMKLGYYVALGGGVLNNGISDNDLDLLLVPMTPQSDFDAIKAHIRKIFGWMVESRVTSAWHYTFPHRKLDVTVVDVMSQQLPQI